MLKNYNYNNFKEIEIFCKDIKFLLQKKWIKYSQKVVKKYLLVCSLHIQE